MDALLYTIIIQSLFIFSYYFLRWSFSVHKDQSGVMWINQATLFDHLHCFQLPSDTAPKLSNVWCVSRLVGLLYDSLEVISSSQQEVTSNSNIFFIWVDRSSILESSWHEIVFRFID